MMEKRNYVDLSDDASSSDEREVRDEEEEELELGLSLKVHTGGKSKGCGGAWGDYCRILTAKDFPAALGSRASPLSSSSSVSSSASTKRVSDPSGSANPPSQVVVGWPPIRAFRMNSLFHQAKDNNNNPTDDDHMTNKKKDHNLGNSNSNNNECINSKIEEKRAGNTQFVKVNMDGDPIGRKVDLNAHQSYETLALALDIMFHNPTAGLCSLTRSTMRASKLLDGSAEFALTYEDRDGDWMLVGDVPWGMFLDTVKRLRIMRTSDANGLAPRYQSSTGGLLRRKPA